ncbi:MAG: hypothetical protein GY719_23935 [bacterium]|nr:hypothetical protein [bacterium]
MTKRLTIQPRRRNVVPGTSAAPAGIRSSTGTRVPQRKEEDMKLQTAIRCGVKPFVDPAG